MNDNDTMFDLKEAMRRALEKMGLWPALSVVFIDHGGPDVYVIFIGGSPMKAVARVYAHDVERAEYRPDGKLLKTSMVRGFRVYPCDEKESIDPEDGAQPCMDCLDSRTALAACMGMLVNYAYDMVVPS